MRRGFLILLVASACIVAAARLSAQAAPDQNTPANSSQKPATTAPKPADANQFPTDTSNVPVMPSKDTSAVPDYGSDNSGAARRMALPAEDLDPARSPDGPVPDAGAGNDSSSSDSRSGLDKILPGPDDDQPQGKHRKLTAPEPEHKETSAEDIEVGKYYLDNKNWKAALSRFESAMVLAPDEPEVYWGLAESARHLGNFAEARGYYQKVAEYDPDSRHGKDARKALKEPEIANAKAAPPAPPAK
ncbi:MAG TPA: tetratricopeptide repeat protein [Terracidiphilus sp.]|jgi:tetratricopeptide (TPR) repeat protein